MSWKYSILTGTVVFFEMDLFGLYGGPMVNAPVLGKQVAIEPQAVAILARESDHVVAGFRRQQHASPTHRVVLEQLGGNARVAPRKINRSVGAAHRGSAFEFHVGKIVRLQTVLMASGVHAKCAGGDGFRYPGRPAQFLRRRRFSNWDNDYECQ